MISHSFAQKVPPAMGSERGEGESFLDEASAIAELILEAQRKDGTGKPTWLGPTGYGTPANPLRLVRLGPHLYNGATGIALFFAALERVRGAGRYGDLSLRILQPLRRKLAAAVADPAQASRLDVQIGGFSGLGSFIYSFLRIGEWLDEPSLTEEAHNLTCLVTPERIASDVRVRIQTGSAGAVLALLALHAARPGPNRDGRTPLDLALSCSRHLLETQVSWQGFPRAWPLSPGKPPVGGFCYGAAGIVYALLRLYSMCRRQELWEAAQEGLAFLRALYSPEQHNWRDMRILFQSEYEEPFQGTWKDWWASAEPDPVALLKRRSSVPADGPSLNNSLFPDMWCHGSAGIALGRLAALDVVDGPEVREEIGHALDIAKSLAHREDLGSTQDDLCCGHMGRVEVLHCAHQKLGREDLLDAARTLAERIVRRARERGRYQLSAARGTENFAPGLLQGAAGVGYGLLRLASPGTLPCILLLE